MGLFMSRRMNKKYSKELKQKAVFNKGSFLLYNEAKEV